MASVTNAKLEISLESKKTTVIMTTECGEVVFSNKDKFATWDCIESEESLLIEVAYRFSLPMYLAPKIQANLNRELLFGRVIVDENENVEFRTTINFKGGRSVENVLWNILDFNKEVLAIKNSLFK
ncbi:YbjN domain-containing protein [Colwellia sp. MSW7]|uniref:YbjN domain-containing protein n=1 Tax=Colwellia maritima TaxID=2912588 RepID=A0ABS9X6S4_9GAMM|nr:YbjN domain-containing protein [Colwellia maritima]MCI2285924.1 YbjN domain-containing protein [Colwellia maritima]